MTFHAPLALIAGLFALSFAVASPEAQVGASDLPAPALTIAGLR